MSVRVSDGKQQAIEHVIEHNLPKPNANSEFLVFTDASLSGDERVAGLGWVVCRPDGQIVCEGTGSFIRDCTINEAEAEAVKRAIDQLKAMDWFNAGVTVYCDNDSVVQTFERETKLRSIDAIKDLMDELSAEQVKWLKRDFNQVADDLSGAAREQTAAD